tara:strand:+ start:228 stop:440 length:213 start_codon:yes stop_codon:yes gene_type:complete
MELPINNKDLDTIVKALSLGGDARLYHLLKNVRDDVNLQKDVYANATTEGTVQIYTESDDYKCKHGTCDI